MSEAPVIETPECTTYIYTLSDPDTGAVRYVGKTIRTPAKRLTDHMKEGRYSIKRQMRKRAWILSLGGRRPFLTVVATVVGTFEEGKELEREWIAKLQESCDLLNEASGGAGSNRWTMSPEGRAKIKASKVGIKLGPLSPAHRAACGAAISAAYWRSPRGPHSAETRAKLSAARRKWTPPKATPELKARLVEAQRIRREREGSVRAQYCRTCGTERTVIGTVRRIKNKKPTTRAQRVGLRCAVCYLVKTRASRLVRQIQELMRTAA